jgi:hypothetical protein
VDLLDELPEGITSLRNGEATAPSVAQRFRVAQINDPLFAGRASR